MSASSIALSLQEWQSCRPKPGSTLAGLSLADDEARELARGLSTAILQVDELRTGLAVRTTSWVGRIRLGDLQITVRPKIGELRLFRLVRYAYGLRDLRLFERAGYGDEAEPFPELLIRQLAAETAELLSRGLHRTYVRRDQGLASPRGRIDVQRVAHQGGVRHAALPCTHYPRNEDTLVNQVLLGGLHLGAALTDDTALRASMHRLAATMADQVSIIRLNRATFRRLQRATNRLTAAYRPALTIVEMLAESLGVSLDERAPTLSLPGFLFDMNRLFQAVLSRFLRENLSPYVVRDEYKLQGMMAYVLGRNPQDRPAPQPRPDFVVMNGPKIAALLDAKYIDLWERPIGRDVLYQLAIYALSQGRGGTATTVYPTTSPSAEEQHIEVRDPIHGSGRALVIARPVPLDKLEGYLVPVSSTAATRERAAFARWLAFGDGAAGS